MVTLASFETVASVLESPTNDALRDVVLARIKRVMEPLMTAGNARQFSNRLNKAVVGYTPIKVRIATGIATEMAQSGSSAEDVVKEVNETALDTLTTGALEYLPAKDKAVLLDILKVNAELGHLIERTAEDKRVALMALLLDAHWTLQRLDVLHTALLLLSRGDLKPQNQAVPHWLCRAAECAIREWHSAVFAQSPLLEARLRQPRKTISDVEMGKRLGLPA